MSSESVTYNFKMTMADGPACGETFPAAFIWSSDEPVEISLGMQPEKDEYVHWSLSRELLKRALDGRTGTQCGDLDIQFLKTSYGQLRIQLTGPDGKACLEMNTNTAKNFLAETEDRVRVGDEDLSADVDYTILMILG